MATTEITLGGVCFAKGTKAIKVSVPKHLQNKQGKPDGKTFGRTTGLRMVHFVDAMFRANDSQHATDEVLAATLAAEFPGRVSKASGAKGVPTIQPVSSYRAYHNAGKHGCGDGKHYAASYNADGVARARPTGSGKPKGGKGKAAKGKGKAAK